MREDTQLPLPTLPPGFSPAPGEEKPWDPEEPNPKEEPAIGDKTKDNGTFQKSNNIKPKGNRNKIVRRGGDRKYKYVKGEVASYIKVLSANCASLKNGKLNSLNAEVRSTNANIVTLQETHFREKGKIKMDKSFVVFEAIRTRKGGGTAIAVN